MKKKLLLFAAITMTAACAKAQMHSAMNFIGNATFTAVTFQASQDNAKDTVIIADGNTSVTLPELHYNAMGMTLPSIKFTDLTYVMEGNPMAGTGKFTWEKQYADTVITLADGVTEKHLTNVTLKVVYTHTSGQLDVDVTFKYGSMPSPLHYVQQGYYTVVPNDWNLVGRGTSKNPYKVYDEDDVTAIKDAVTNGASAEGIYFQAMSDVTYAENTYAAGTVFNLPGSADAVASVKADNSVAASKTIKVIKDGRIVILGNGNAYGAAGLEF